MWLWVPFLVLAVAPCWIMLRLRDRALANHNRLDPAVIWFGHLRAATVISTATWLLWLGLVVWLDPWRKLAGALHVHNVFLRDLLHSALAVIPPAGVLVICDAIAFPIVQRIRGLDFTFRETVQDSIRSRFFFGIPGICICASVGAFAANYKHLGTGLMLGGLVILVLFIWLSDQRNRAMNLTSHTISEGPLRDRAFALAEQAKVKLQQIHLIPVARFRLANAFAAQGNNLILTDWLLKHCTRREVDAVIAHELGHMKHKHAEKLSGIQTGFVVLLMIALQCFREFKLPDAAWIGFALLVGLNFAKLVNAIVSRRWERVADREAVEISRDPEAMISGLARLDRLNLLPHHWDKLTATVLTHPSTARRVQAIAALGNVPHERISTLLQSAPDTCEHYSLPPMLARLVETGEQPVYSGRFKSHLALCSTGWILASIVLPPLGVAWILARQTWDEPLRSTFYIMGMLLTFLVILLTTDRAGQRRMARLRKPLAEQLRKKGFAFNPDDVLFVALSPHAAPRAYEAGCSNWDVGFLLLEAEHIVYVGEQTQFKLRRDQIRSVGAGPGEPNWLPSCRVYVQWLHGTFNLARADTVSLSQTRTDVAELARKLTRWLEAQPGEHTPSELVDKLDAPQSGEVTSKSLKADATLPNFFLLFCVLFALQLALVKMTGLSRVSAFDSLYALSMVPFGAIVLFWPTWRFRETAR